MNIIQRAIAAVSTVAVAVVACLPVANAQDIEYLYGDVPDTTPAMVVDIDDLGYHFCVELDAETLLCEVAPDGTDLFDV